MKRTAIAIGLTLLFALPVTAWAGGFRTWSGLSGTAWDSRGRNHTDYRERYRNHDRYDVRHGETYRDHRRYSGRYDYYDGHGWRQRDVRHGWIRWIPPIRLYRPYAFGGYWIGDSIGVGSPYDNIFYPYRGYRSFGAFGCNRW